jgi:threonine dehydratase
MPSISTPSKIAGTRAYTDNVRFSGSTAQERESVVAEVIRETGAVLVPPYDHPDIMLGQGTAALEMLEQYVGDYGKRPDDLKLVLTPCGGGGLLSGTAVFFSDKPTLVVGSEPSYQGADDAMRGLSAKPPKRVEVVKTLTIADGLRTPLGVLPFDLFASDTKSIENVYTVSEDEIKMAMRLVLERMKVFVEPSAVVPLAVVLYNTEFRRWAREQQCGEAWDIAVVLSGGNTTIESIIGLYGPPEVQTAGTARAESKIDEDGRATAENVAG